MKKIICSLFIVASIFSACKGKSGSAADAQSTPTGVANSIFDAAQSGDYSKLKSLCDASLEPDGDSKKVCEVADGDDNFHLVVVILLLPVLEGGVCDLIIV